MSEEKTCGPLAINWLSFLFFFRIIETVLFWNEYCFNLHCLMRINFPQQISSEPLPSMLFPAGIISETFQDCSCKRRRQKLY